MNRSTRRLAFSKALTERIAEGQFDTRVELKRRDELGHLGTSVNRMAERLAMELLESRAVGDDLRLLLRRA